MVSPLREKWFAAGTMRRRADVALSIRCRSGAGRGADARDRTARFRLSLLGGFELRCAGQDVAVSRNGQRLLALLALQGRPLERLWVAGTRWLDAPEERAGASLRSALWRLPQPGGTAVVEASATHLRLARHLAVDTRELVAPAECLESPAGCRDHQPEPAALARDLLPDWYEDWVLERERFRQLRLHALEALCARLTEAGRFGAAVQAGLAAVSGEPLRESAHRWASTRPS
jgi:DNA-binding SARP family transcriptional activator